MWWEQGDPDPFPLDLPQDSDSQTCPFCRCEIKGQEAVSIHQFRVGATVEDPEGSSDEEEPEQVSRPGRSWNGNPQGLREEGACGRLLGCQGHKLLPPLGSEAMTFSSITLPRIGLCLTLHSTSKAYKAPECWASWQGDM